MGCDHNCSSCNEKCEEKDLRVKAHHMSSVKKVIGIVSGKGGVGKSTTSVNLAIALAMQGKKVALLDADIYGPNAPRMLGVEKDKPEVDEKLKKLIPLQAYGIEMMSMGILYDEGQSLIWRGPMIIRAIEQMLSDVLWDNLDVMVIDMPPGTGDVQLTLAQSVPVTAGVAVSTPQKVALDDGARALDMFAKLKTPVAGIIENMSGFICPGCGEEYDIFGKGTTEEVANVFGTQVLACVPIEPIVREGGDNGKPIVYFHPESKSAKEYLKAAKLLWEFIEEVNAKKLADNSTIQPVNTGRSSINSLLQTSQPSLKAAPTKSLQPQKDTLSLDGSFQTNVSESALLNQSNISNSHIRTFCRNIRNYNNENVCTFIEFHTSGDCTSHL